MAKGKFSFRDKVGADVERQESRRSHYGYLNLPTGIKMFKEEMNSKVLLDFVCYDVTDERHPDRNDDKETALPDTPWFKRPFKTHRNVGVENEVIVCPTSFGKKCPICEQRQLKLRANADKEELRQLSASHRNLYIVVPRDVPKYEEEVHLWDISWHNFQKALNEELKENEEFRDFPSPDKDGYTLRVRFGEEAVGTNKFASASRIDFVERDDDIEDDLLKDAPNLDEILQVMSYAEIQAKFFEVDEDEVKEREEDRKERSSSRERRESREQEKDEGDRDDDRKARRRQRREEETAKDEGNGKEERQSRRSREREDDSGKDKERSERRRDNDGDNDRRSARGRGRDEEPEKDEGGKDERRGKGNGKEKAAAKVTECPYDHRFGRDNNKFKECDNCEVWEQCLDFKESAAAARA